MVRERAVPSLESLPDLLTVTEARAVLRMGIGSMYELLREKRVASVRLGRKILIPKRAILEMVAGEAGGQSEE